MVPGRVPPHHVEVHSTPTTIIIILFATSPHNFCAVCPIISIGSEKPDMPVPSRKML
jgi:hypothetical protein